MFFHPDNLQGAVGVLTCFIMAHYGTKISDEHQAVFRPIWVALPMLVVKRGRALGCARADRGAASGWVFGGSGACRSAC